MTKRRIFKGLLLVVVILIGPGATAALWLIFDARKTPSATPEYVALGSSYAAGAGLGPRQPGSPRLCGRSNNGYPPRLARKLGLSLVDMSCSGSVTSDVLVGGQYFQGAQIRTLSRRTRLVTITVGGNDVGFIRDLMLLASRNSDSAMGWIVGKLWNGPPALSDRNFAGLQRELASLIRTVRRRSPDAKLVVITYPPVLPARGTCPRLQLTASGADMMRRVQEKLADVTRLVAEQQGAIIVDMHGLGTDHSACSTAPWTSGWGPVSQAPFHPTLLGAQATADAIAAALRDSAALARTQTPVQAQTPLAQP